MASTSSGRPTSGSSTITLTLQGLVYGITTALRLTAVVLAFALFNVALEPDDQLGLLSRFSFRSGLVLSLAARLLPVLSSDGAHIADAQRARGMELDRGTRRARATARLPLLGALLTRSLERAVDVAAAMEARGYGSGRRSQWLHRRPWRAADAALAGGAVLAAVALLAGLLRGAVGYDFYPLLDDPWAQLTDPWWLVTLVALAASRRPVAGERTHVTAIAQFEGVTYTYPDAVAPGSARRDADDQTRRGHPAAGRLGQRQVDPAARPERPRPALPRRHLRRSRARSTSSTRGRPGRTTWRGASASSSRTRRARPS